MDGFEVIWICGVVEWGAVESKKVEGKEIEVGFFWCDEMRSKKRALQGHWSREMRT